MCNGWCHVERDRGGDEAVSAVVDTDDLGMPRIPEGGPSGGRPPSNRHSLVHPLQGDCELIVERELEPGCNCIAMTPEGGECAVVTFGEKGNLSGADPPDQLDQFGPFSLC